MLLEIAKVLIPLLGGGAAGALLNEWLRRRGAKVQVIPLVERVNRLVRPGLRGFTLARTLDDGRLEQVKNVREYQFTLRNTSPVHLQDAEIQFEFPADDVEGRAERPSLSNTAPVVVDAIVSPPWRKAFRWRIPQFPSTDSVEFTFRAVDPASGDYEVALYKSDRVVIEKSQGEPKGGRTGISLSIEGGSGWKWVLLTFTAGAAIFALLLPGISGKHLSSVSGQGCSVTVVSSFEQLSPGLTPWQGPFRLTYEVLNTGTQACTVQFGNAFGAPTTVEPSAELTRVEYSPTRPKLVSRDFWLSSRSLASASKASVTLYAP